MAPALSGLIAARWMTPTDYAVFALSLTVVSAWQAITDLGLTSTLIPAARSLSDRDEHFTVMLTMGSIGLCVCTAVGFGLQSALGLQSLGLVTLVHATTLPLLALVDPPISHGIRTLDFTPIFLRQVGPALMMSTTTVILAALEVGPASFAIGCSAGVATAAIILPRTVSWRPTLRRPGDTVRKAISFGREVLVSRLSGFVVGQLDAVVLSALCGPSATGLWRMATQIWGLPMGLVPPILQVMSGHINACRDDPSAMRRIHHGYAMWSFVAMWCLSLLVVVCAPTIVLALLGQHWSEATPIIQATFAVTTGPMVMINNEMARVMQRNAPYLWFSIFRSGLTILALTLGAAISFKGFLVAWVICGILGTGANIWVFFRFCAPFSPSALYLWLYAAGVLWSAIVILAIQSNL